MDTANHYDEKERARLWACTGPFDSSLPSMRWWKFTAYSTWESEPYKSLERDKSQQHQQPVFWWTSATSLTVGPIILPCGRDKELGWLQVHCWQLYTRPGWIALGAGICGLLVSSQSRFSASLKNSRSINSARSRVTRRRLSFVSNCFSIPASVSRILRTNWPWGSSVPFLPPRVQHPVSPSGEFLSFQIQVTVTLIESALCRFPHRTICFLYPFFRGVGVRFAEHF